MNISADFERVDAVHHVLETSVNSVAIVLNLFLLYLITYHSTFRVPVYQILLGIDAGLDLLLGIVVLVGQPVGLTGDGYFIMITNGFYAHSSDTYDCAMLTLFASVLHMNVLWIPVQFTYRYIFLCRRENGDSARTLTYAVVIVAVVWNFVGFAVIYAMYNPPDEFQPEGRRILAMNDWPFDAEKPPKVFGAYLTDTRLVVWELLWFISSGGGAIIVVTCELNIMKHLRAHGGGYHETTRQMHREFHRALMAMAICPLITSGIPIFFFIITICFALCPGPVSAFMASGCSWITVFNPLTTIFFMRCYRDVVLKALWRRRSRVAMTDATEGVTGLEATTADARITT